MISSLLCIGIIGRPHGLRGEVYVRLFIDVSDRLNGEESLYLENEENGIGAWFPVEVWNIHQKNVLVKLAGVDDRDAASRIGCSIIKIATDGAGSRWSDFYAVDDILGLDVRTEDGQLMGTIKDVWSKTGQDIWIVRQGDKEYLLPAVKAFVRRIDFENRVVVVEPVDGLFNDVEN